ncbi:hypothetical protein GCM10017687_29950 [Streptomyces echinatus]
MEIKRSTAPVTGADRDIGYACARALVARGAARVYAGVRDPARVGDENLVPLRVDVSVPEEVAAPDAAAGDQLPRGVGRVPGPIAVLARNIGKAAEQEVSSWLLSHLRGSTPAIRPCTGRP